MMRYVIDLFPQAEGSPSAEPPPRALFEDFFGSLSAPSPPLHFNWFNRIRVALVNADSSMASVLSAGRSDISFLPAYNPLYAFQGEHSLARVVLVNPPLLSHFERPLLQMGITLREAMALESSCCSHSAALSHSMWVLSGLLGFMRLQGFFPSDPGLFSNIVTSLSKSLAHQASLSAFHTAFLCLKRCEFYLSHLDSPMSIKGLCCLLRLFVQTFCLRTD